MKNVQTILNKEAKLVKELEAVKGQKEQMAIIALTEAKEIITALGCEYLLDSKAIVEKPVKISIKKGKVVKVTKEVKVEVPVVKEVIKEIEVVKEVKNTTEIDKLKAEIEKLKKTVATYQRKETEQRKEIEKLQAELTKKPVLDLEPKVVKAADCYDDEYLEFLAAQEESILAGIEIMKEEVVTKPAVKDKAKFVKESPARFVNNPKARIYQTDRCYLIASPTTKGITWMSNEILSDDYKKSVEDILVKQYNFNAVRQELSPVVIKRDNAYMARAAAKEGFQKFSGKDLLCGYVNINGKFYLYSYMIGAPKPFIESLDKKIVNAEKTKPSENIVTQVKYIVFDMYKEYKALTTSIIEEEKAREQEAANSFNANQEAIRKLREEDEALIIAAGFDVNNINKKESDNKKDKPKALSATLAALADEFEMEF